MEPNGHESSQNKSSSTPQHSLSCCSVYIYICLSTVCYFTHTSFRVMQKKLRTHCTHVDIFICLCICLCISVACVAYGALHIKRRGNIQIIYQSSANQIGFSLNIFVSVISVPRSLWGVTCFGVKENHQDQEPKGCPWLHSVVWCI